MSLRAELPTGRAHELKSDYNTPGELLKDTDFSTRSTGPWLECQDGSFINLQFVARLYNLGPARDKSGRRSKREA